jgi:hypothetical protein
MGTCRICVRAGLRERLDFGPQAIRNRFLCSSDESQYTHGLAIGCCCACGTVQLLDPPPVAELRPRFDWIKYNEPERHLDEVAATLARLPGITPESKFAGLSYKDDSTLARLNALGFAATWRPEIRADLGIESSFAGIESIQERLTPSVAETLAVKFGQPDVLLVRHVLEHAHDTRAALEWASKLVRPNGYVALEVPDATRALERFDYTTVWEEHVLYFTPATLRGCLERNGFEIVALESHPYTLENSLVAIVQSGQAARTSPASSMEMIRGARFVREFPRIRGRMYEQLRDQGRIAMLGAGHMTSGFVNLYGLADRIEFVVDDSPNKQGLFMPGSSLPILPSSELVEREVDLCLMSVRPEIEEAVAAKNAAFTARGGRLASVFPDSPYSLERTLQKVAA